MIYSASTENQCGVSRMEAEFLFNLADQVKSEDMDESFKTLFVGAISNHLVSLLNVPLFERDKALDIEAWLKSDKGMWATALSRLTQKPSEQNQVEQSQTDQNKSGGDEINVLAVETVEPKPRKTSALMKWLKSRRTDKDEAQGRKPEQGYQKPNEIDQAEASWLIERLNRDGKISEMEEALLAFLHKDCPNIHASLVKFKTAA